MSLYQKHEKGNALNVMISVKNEYNIYAHKKTCVVAYTGFIQAK